MSCPGSLRLEADLIVDTGFAPRHAGMRSGQGDRRQLLYRAGDLYLDVSLHRRAEPSELALIGQLAAAGASSRNLADLPVVLDCAGGERLRTRSNGLGEFLLTHLPEGVTSLGIELDGWTSIRVSLPAAAAAEVG